MDITAKGIDADAYAEHLRALGKAGDRRLTNGGYVIWNKRIASERQGWAWRRYSGSNGHTKHIHLSLSTLPASFDSRASWGISGVGRPKPPPPPTDPNKGRHYRTFVIGATDPMIYKLGGRNDQIAELQILTGQKVDGIYGRDTAAAVVKLKSAANWLDASGAPDRSSRVDERLAKAIRALAGKH